MNSTPSFFTRARTSAGVRSCTFPPCGTTRDRRDASGPAGAGAHPGGPGGSISATTFESFVSCPRPSGQEALGQRRTARLDHEARDDVGVAVGVGAPVLEVALAFLGDLPGDTH